MERKEKLKMIQSLSEEKLTKEVLIPLFREMGFKDISYTHGVLEYGKDIIYYEEDKFHNRNYIGVQVKKNKINVRLSNKIFSQICAAFGEGFKDLSDNKIKELDKFVILTSNDINANANESLFRQLKGANLNKIVSLINGDKLIDLMNEYMPKYFWKEYEKFNIYFKSMKEDFEIIKDISAIGQKEEVPLEQIYVSLKLIEVGDEREIYIEQYKKLGIKLQKPRIDIFQIDKTQIDNIKEDELFKEENLIIKELIFEVNEVLDNFKKVVIIGTPGSGKTTLIKHIALMSAKENFKAVERKIVPIPIKFREFYEGKVDVREYINIVFEKYNFLEAEEKIEKHLLNGKCQLLFDGFDELPNIKIQKEVTKLIEEFILKYPNNQFIVTSRTAGYHDELKNFEKLELMEFNDKQIEQFIQNWFTKEEKSKATSMYKAIMKNEKIIEIARNPLMISIIAVIYEEEKELPHRRVDLYHRCVEVLLSRRDQRKRIKNRYSSEKKEYILRKLAYYFHKNKLRVVKEDKIIKEMLKHFPRLSLKKEDVKSFLNELWQRNWLLRQQSMDSYDFLHLSFQEYFTALEIEKENKISEQMNHIDDSWWEEPILLYVGINQDATKLIKKIKKEVKEDIFFSNLIFYGKCIADAEFTEQKLKKEIIDKLWDLSQKVYLFSLKPEDYRPYLIEGDVSVDLIMALDVYGYTISSKSEITKINDVKWKIKDGYNIYVIIDIGTQLNIYKKGEFEDLTEKALNILVLIKNEDVVNLLKKNLEIKDNGMLKDEDIDVIRKSAEVLSKIGSEDALKNLIKLLKDKYLFSVELDNKWYLIKGDISEELRIAFNDNNDPISSNVKITKINTEMWEIIDGNKIYIIKDTGTQLKIYKKKNFRIQKVALDAIGNIETEIDFTKLIKILNNKDRYVRMGVANTLGKIGKDFAVKPLMNALDNEKNLMVKKEIIKALGKIGEESAVDSLIEVMKNNTYYFVQMEVAEALGRIGSERGVDTLINALNDINMYVRMRAALSLGKMVNEIAIEPLIRILNDKESVGRGDAIYVLGYIGSEQIIWKLIECLNDRDLMVQKKAADALGNIGSELVIQPLINAFNNNNNMLLHEGVLNALGKINNELAFNFLIETLEHKDSNVRGVAAEVLGNIGSADAIEPLIVTLKDEDEVVRKKAVDALGNIGSELAVEPLIGTLNDTNMYVKESAVYALGNIGSELAVEPLIVTLNDENSIVKGRAAEVLGNLGDEQTIEPLKNMLNDDKGYCAPYKVKDHAYKALEKISKKTGKRIYADEIT